MNVWLAYILVAHSPQAADYAARFVLTYHRYPPGAAHSTVIVANGGPPSTQLELTFAPLSPQFFPRPNDGGWDLSGFIATASGPARNADLLVCFGESVYFHRAGWLRRLVQVFEKHGAGMYGCFASYLVRPHLGTTAFAIPPALLRASPFPHDRRSRYDWEHGSNAFWKRVQNVWHKPALLVTWDGEYDWKQWRRPANGLFKGTQEDLLVWCNHTDRYVAAEPETRHRWQANADKLVWA